MHARTPALEVNASPRRRRRRRRRGRLHARGGAVAGRSTTDDDARRPPSRVACARKLAVACATCCAGATTTSTARRKTPPFRSRMHWRSIDATHRSRANSIATRDRSIDRSNHHHPHRRIDAHPTRGGPRVVDRLAWTFRKYVRRNVRRFVMYIKSE